MSLHCFGFCQFKERADGGNSFCWHGLSAQRWNWVLGAKTENESWRNMLSLWER